MPSVAPPLAGQPLLSLGVMPSVAPPRLADQPLLSLGVMPSVAPPRLAGQPLLSLGVMPSVARPRLAGQPLLSLAGRPLLSLGVLQLLLGLSSVALSCGALSVSDSQPVRRACPLWAGSSVILSGIVGLTTWRRPVLLLVNVFVLLSVMCVLLNLSAFILCCQGAQLVSSMNSCTLSETGDVCHCCSISLTSGCPEDELLLLSAGSSCSSMRLLLKKVLFGLSALNALSTAVCLVAAGLRYLQMFTARPPWATEESGVPVEDGTEPDALPDPDEFVAPAPPPSYFSMFYSYTPRLARRMFGDSAVVPHASGGVRMKGAELFPPSDPPPPYEEVAGSSAPNAATTTTTTTVTQETELSTITCNTPVRGPVSDTCLQTVLEVSGGSLPPTPPKCQQQASPGGQQRAAASLLQQRAPHMRRSNSDPLLTELTTKVPVVTPGGPRHHHHAHGTTSDSATQTSQPTLLVAAPPGSRNEGGTGPPGSRNEGGTAPPGSRNEGGTGPPGSRNEGGTGPPGSRNEGGTGPPGSRNEGGTGPPGSRNEGGTGPPGSRNEGGTAPPGSRNEGGTGPPGSRNEGGTSGSVSVRLRPPRQQQLQRRPSSMVDYQVGRHTGIPEEQRLCALCDLGVVVLCDLGVVVLCALGVVVEDEFHFVFYCPLCHDLRKFLFE